MIQETNLKPYFIYNSENHQFPLVVSIPHSGTQLTREMQETLLPDVVLSNMDWYLPQLYAFLAEWGVTVLVNPISRYVIDPNRPPFQKIGDAYTTNCIYETTTSGEPMYAAPLTEAVRLERKRCYYDAYHQALKQLLAEKKQRFSKVYFLDLHSYGMDTGSDAIIGTQFGQTLFGSLFYRFTNFIGAGRIAGCRKSAFCRWLSHKALWSRYANRSGSD